MYILIIGHCEGLMVDYAKCTYGCQLPSVGEGRPIWPTPSIQSPVTRHASQEKSAATAATIASDADSTTNPHCATLNVNAPKPQQLAKKTTTKQRVPGHDVKLPIFF